MYQHRQLLLAFGYAVQLRGVRHDQGIANTGNAASEVSHAVLLNQVGNLVPVVVDVILYREIVDRIHGGFPQRSVRFAAVVVENLAVCRVGSVLVDARQLEGGGVGVAGVNRAVHDAHGIVRSNLV